MPRNIYYIFIRILFIAIISTNIRSLAGPWLPQVGEYKVYLGFSQVDNRSKKEILLRKGLYFKTLDKISVLKSVQESIITGAKISGRELLNSELRQIETIDYDITNLSGSADELSTFTDDSFSTFEVEYGATEKDSFGVKILYKKDHLSTLSNNNYSYSNTGKEADLYYKKKLLEYNNWTITLRPKINISSIAKKSSIQHVDLALLIGHSSLKKNKEVFGEFGIELRKHNDKFVHKPLGYLIIIQEGIKFGKKWILSNYTEYEKVKSRSHLYRTTIYDQVSLAREFTLNETNIYGQLGYFWKYSIVDRNYRISGPVFSLYFNL